ncbi:chloride channel protein [Clostridium sp. MD294]|uniref:chloride channel protein n=1 Tax=Clostridium sp. MD294 TaxID=97138 RepID=UPI0002CAF7B0|nr:chloride channel protein [Clostridium sp. MD294]NDO45904.1 chloride channel protein [Clostridium sp. MD294]USF30437.1 Chloride/fluoride channel protein [Clostridium sp. MD294]
MWKKAYEQFRIFGEWVFFGCVVGIIVGIVGVLFHFGIELATEYRIAHPWVLFLLPFGGLAIVYFYHLEGMDKDGGTNFILVSVRTNENITIKMAPLIFVSTIITHFFGGSSGREGAALQLGGSIAGKLGRILELDEKDERIMTMCGMSAAFAALFGTPIASVVFSMEVISVGIMHYSAIVPCTISALIGAGLSRYFGIEPTAFLLTGTPQGISFSMCINVMFFGVIGAVLSILFCTTMKKVSALYKTYFPNPYKRVFVGGCIVIVLTYMVGTRNYNGAGMDVIQWAFYGGIEPFAFLLKIVFTAVTLGAGFKGGEIVPSFFVGATFGATMSHFMELSPSFGAALGMAALFCGVTNCPLSAVILSVELFGGENIVYYMLVCAISYMLSGYYGLYSEQKIMYSKVKPEFINRNAE